MHHHLFEVLFFVDINDKWSVDIIKNEWSVDTSKYKLTGDII